ncbi:Glucan endo-1,3-beta-glucosidase [Corchorus olitorius]|uniref:Glucan endo-1,3-beta-glucosidase n=1 Tax=Corchorus olitorius TaxID=93759 RepID=A0A1R3K6A3_9ROSI|nr:Glucan endo-1,3-beta-glucosidase [Corchorus olitorius]
MAIEARNDSKVYHEISIETRVCCQKGDLLAGSPQVTKLLDNGVKFIHSANDGLRIDN